MPTQVTSVRGETSTTVNYGYDGFGRRYKKEVVGGMTTYYLGDHFEIKGGTPVKYIFAGNLRVAQVEGSTLTYLHKDHLGSSSVMTDSSGFETESTQYMPYGSARSGSGEITDTSYLYTDQEFDTENGLYNYDARLYDPVIGRFISADTIVPQPLNPQSLNRYTYCLNNPLIYVDPSGHTHIREQPFFPPFSLQDAIDWYMHEVVLAYYRIFPVSIIYWVESSDTPVDEPLEPVLPENIEFLDEKGKNLAETLLNDSELGRKLIEEIAEYPEKKVIVKTYSGDDQSHCSPLDENDVLTIEINLTTPPGPSKYKYNEARLAHEFAHAIDFLSGEYDDYKNFWERLIRREAKWKGWDEDTIKEKLDKLLYEKFESPAYIKGFEVDRELREKRDEGS